MGNENCQNVAAAGRCGWFAGVIAAMLRVLFVVAVLCPAWCGGAGATGGGGMLVVGSAEGQAAENSAEVDSTTEQADQRETARLKGLRLALLVGLLVVVMLFAAMLLLSLSRSARFARRKAGLGRKAERTEYIDAWSRYRLKDDPTKDDNEDKQQ